MCYCIGCGTPPSPITHTRSLHHAATATTTHTCSLATGLGVQHLGAHTILRQLMGFWLQVRVWVGGWGAGQLAGYCEEGEGRGPASHRGTGLDCDPGTAPQVSPR